MEGSLIGVIFGVNLQIRFGYIKKFVSLDHFHVYTHTQTRCSTYSSAQIIFIHQKCVLKTPLGLSNNIRNNTSKNVFRINMQQNNV